MSEIWFYESTNPNNFIRKIYCLSISYNYYKGRKYFWVVVDKNNTQYNLEDKIIDTLYLNSEEIIKITEARENLKILKSKNKLSKRLYDFIKNIL